jgi:hypothetical protein
LDKHQNIGCTKLEKIPTLEIVLRKKDMNRRVLVTMLWKDIRQLDLMTEGFLIINEYPEDVIQMVYQKTLDIQTHLQNLSLYKEDIQDIRLPGEPEDMPIETPTETMDESVDDDLSTSVELIADDELNAHEVNVFESVTVSDEQLSETENQEENYEHTQFQFSNSDNNTSLTNENGLENEEVESDAMLVEYASSPSPDFIQAEEPENELMAVDFEAQNLNEIEEPAEQNEEIAEEYSVAEEPIHEQEMNTVEVTEDETNVESETENQEIEPVGEEDENPTMETLDTVESIDETPLMQDSSAMATVQNGNLVIPGFDEVSMESASNDSKVLEEKVPTFQPSLFAATADQSHVFGVENRRITDVKKAISIGERFRFQRELFNGNGEDMNKTLTYINHAVTLAEAMDFLEKKYKWERYNESAADFYRIIKRRFI